LAEVGVMSEAVPGRPRRRVDGAEQGWFACRASAVADPRRRGFGAAQAHTTPDDL